MTEPGEAEPGVPTAARHRCTIRTTDGEVVETTVRDGALLITPFVGQHGSPIQIGCRGGGCGVCRVQVVEGDHRCKRMSRRFVSEQDERDGYALACRLLVVDDLVVRACPPMP